MLSVSQFWSKRDRCFSFLHLRSNEEKNEARDRLDNSAREKKKEDKKKTRRRQAQRTRQKHASSPIYIEPRKENPTRKEKQKGHQI